MKTVILSDIHSNIHALEAILKHEKEYDLVYCAGDLIDYGPNPKQVIDWARENQIPCVKGNHDQWVVMQYRDGKFADLVAKDERAWVHHNASLL
jgi:predicted phosphodiesterase